MITVKVKKKNPSSDWSDSPCICFYIHASHSLFFIKILFGKNPEVEYIEHYKHSVYQMFYILGKPLSLTFIKSFLFVLINPLHSRGDCHIPFNVLRQLKRWFALTTHCTTATREVIRTHISLCYDNSSGDSHSPLIVLRQLERWLSLTTHCITTTREETHTQHSVYCATRGVTDK